MGTTKRPQNKCKSCGYTWYPRGKHLSLKCPSCGGKEVSTVGTGGVLLALGILAAIFFSNNSKHADTAPQPTTPSIASEATVPTDAQPTKSVPPNNINTANGKTEEENLRSPEESIEKEPAEKHSDSPTAICESESNFISRNNCMWRECEKPEFTDLEECADKKPKDNRGGG